jgi:F0F1-type ATP synthase membrane subunit b/b'
MSGARRWHCFVWMLLVVLFAAVSAGATEEGGNAATQRTNELFKWINFAIVAFALMWIFARALPQKFRQNADTISSAIAKATVAKAEAERQMSDAEMRLLHLPQEITQLRATVQREAAAEAERLRMVTRSDVEKVALAAKAEVEAAERAARLQLKVIAANRAVDGAESLLAAKLTPKTQESLVGSFVASLEARPN